MYKSMIQRIGSGEENVSIRYGLRAVFLQVPELVHG